jgi:hypothetical protein
MKEDLKCSADATAITSMRIQQIVHLSTVGVQSSAQS